MCEELVEEVGGGAVVELLVEGLDGDDAALGEEGAGLLVRLAKELLVEVDNLEVDLLVEGLKGDVGLAQGDVEGLGDAVLAEGLGDIVLAEGLGEGDVCLAEGDICREAVDEGQGAQGQGEVGERAAAGSEAGQVPAAAIGERSPAGHHRCEGDGGAPAGHQRRPAARAGQGRTGAMATYM